MSSESNKKQFSERRSGRKRISAKKKCCRHVTNRQFLNHPKSKREKTTGRLICIQFVFFSSSLHFFYSNYLSFERNEIWTNWSCDSHCHRHHRVPFDRRNVIREIEKKKRKENQIQSANIEFYFIVTPTTTHINEFTLVSTSAVESEFAFVFVYNLRSMW